jgi:hypothetical protein
MCRVSICVSSDFAIARFSGDLLSFAASTVRPVAETLLSSD